MKPRERCSCSTAFTEHAQMKQASEHCDTGVVSDTDPLLPAVWLVCWRKCGDRFIALKDQQEGSRVVDISGFGSDPSENETLPAGSFGEDYHEELVSRRKAATDLLF